jgi:hypothetical protein
VSVARCRAGLEIDCLSRSQTLQRLMGCSVDRADVRPGAGEIGLRRFDTGQANDTSVGEFDRIAIDRRDYSSEINAFDGANRSVAIFLINFGGNPRTDRRNRDDDSSLGTEK